MAKIIHIISSHSINYHFLIKLNLKVVSPYLDMSKRGYWTRYITHKFHLNISRFNQLNPEILELNPEVIFIWESSLYFIDGIARLRQAFPKARLIYLYSNIIKNKSYIHPDLLDKYNCEKYSWDNNDCIRYGISNSKSFYFNSFVLLPDTQIVYDAVFIGLDKGRYSLLKKIESYLNSHGMRTYFHIVGDNILTRYKRMDYKRPISYDEYLEYTKKSNCIIDIVQEGQCGTTMRTFEAVFNNRKLITNNKHMKEYDFYHPNNIFILDEAVINDELLDFMKLPVVPIAEDIINTYSFSSWLKQFNLI